MLLPNLGPGMPQWPHTGKCPLRARQPVAFSPQSTLLWSNFRFTAKTACVVESFPNPPTFMWNEGRRRFQPSSWRHRVSPRFLLRPPSACSSFLSSPWWRGFQKNTVPGEAADGASDPTVQLTFENPPLSSLGAASERKPEHT